MSGKKWTDEEKEIAQKVIIKLKNYPARSFYGHASGPPSVWDVLFFQNHINKKDILIINKALKEVENELAKGRADKERKGQTEGINEKDIKRFTREDCD